MQDFQTTFTRYGNGHRQISAVHHMRAESFQDAAFTAGQFARMMHEADPARAYDVVSVAAVGYSGEQCETVAMTIWGDPFPETKGGK